MVAASVGNTAIDDVRPLQIRAHTAVVPVPPSKQADSVQDAGADSDNPH